MPDAVAKRIIDDEVAPHFQAGDFDAGLIAGVNAIITPTGKTVAEKTATWQQLKQEPDQDWLLRFSEGEYTFTDGPGRISPFVRARTARAYVAMVSDRIAVEGPRKADWRSGSAALDRAPGSGGRSPRRRG